MSAAPCSSVVQSGCYWSVKEEWSDLARCHMAHDRNVAKAATVAAAAAGGGNGNGNGGSGGEGATANVNAPVVGEIDKEASEAVKENKKATATIASAEHESDTARHESETERHLVVQQMLTLTNRQYEGTTTLTSEDTTTLLQHLSVLLNNERQHLTGTRGATLEAPTPSQKMAKDEHLRHMTKPVLRMIEKAMQGGWGEINDVD